jgi:hypothetical protein
METLTFQANVSDDGKVTLTLPDRFRGASVKLSCFISRRKNSVTEKRDWITFVDHVYGSINDPNFEAPYDPPIWPTR